MGQDSLGIVGEDFLSLLNWDRGIVRLLWPSWRAKIRSSLISWVSCVAWNGLKVREEDKKTALENGGSWGQWLADRSILSDQRCLERKTTGCQVNWALLQTRGLIKALSKPFIWSRRDRSLLYVYEYFASMYVYVPTTCVFGGQKHLIPWYWSYGWL